MLGASHLARASPLIRTWLWQWNWCEADALALKMPIMRTLRGSSGVLGAAQSELVTAELELSRP